MTQHERYTAAVARYFEAWNATEEGALGKGVAAAFDEEATYTDPLVEVVGHEGLAAAIAGVHAQFPGFVFRPSGEVDGHHDIARFGWELVSGDGGTSHSRSGDGGGSAPVAGFDVVRLGEDGRIRSVLGFLDRVPTV